MYDKAIAEAICERIAEGQSLRAICADDGMPNKATFLRWLNEDEEIATKYAHAREAQADVLFEDMADVEDKVLCGDLKPDAARVVLDSRRWRAEKLKPKVYGNKVEHEHKGSVRVFATQLDEDI